MLKHARLISLEMEEKTMSKKTERVEVCTCEKCGNEGEMTVTCELVEVEVEDRKVEKERKSFTCIHCGNEADMIVDL